MTAIAAAPRYSDGALTLVRMPDRSRTSAPSTRKVIELRENGSGGLDVAELYDGHGSSLFGFALNALGDRGEAEECVQDTFVRAWRARHSYRPEIASVRTWLFAIARNVVTDAYRSRARRPQPQEAAEDERNTSQSDRTSASLDRVVVTEALARLSEEHREVVVQIRFNQLSYGELAERTGVPVATLRTRMYYALKALRETLKEVGEDHA